MDKLDSGWSFVIGAIIALIGSIAAPWIREWWVRRRTASDAHQAEVKDALIEFQRAVLEFITVRYLRPLAEADLHLLHKLHFSLVRLQFAVLKKDVAIAVMAEDLAARWVAKDVDVKTGDYAQTRFSARSAEWFRGTASSAEAGERYERDIEQHIAGRAGEAQAQR